VPAFGLVPATGWVECVGILQRRPAGPGGAAFVEIWRVRHIEIIGLRRSHDDVVALGRKLLAHVHVAPADEIGAGLVDAAAMARLFPGAGDLALRTQEGLDALEEAGLQRCSAGDAEFLRS